MSTVPFYSVQDLCKAFSDPPEKVRDALVAAGVLAYRDGKVADLSGWESPAQVSGDTIWVRTPHAYEPHPSEVIVSAETLPESWKQYLCFGSGATSASSASPRAGATQASGTKVGPMADLATPQQLIDAFGVFTGMNASWFRNLKDSPALMRARRLEGQGGRHHRDPLFAPYEVMLWLVNPKLKKAKPLSLETGWRRFKECFPAAYQQVEALDPNQD